MKRILLVCMIMGVWSFQAQEESSNCPVVGNENQSFCESEGTGNNYYRPAVQHLEITANGDGVMWYDTATSTEPLSMSDFLVDGEDYYADNASGTCEQRAVVTVTINDSPSAGATTFHTVALDGEPFDLVDVFQNSMIGPAEAGGTVTPALASGGTIFDPAVDTGGQYRYEVASTNEFCPDDEAYMYITVVPEGGDIPGEDEPGEIDCPVVEFTEQEFCESQGTGNDFYQPAVAHLSASANGDGIVWYDSLTSTEALASDVILVNGEDYYAGNASGSCTERTRVDVVVHNSPSAGSTTFVTFCSEAGSVDLMDYLNPSMIGAADPGGTVVPPLSSGTTMFDPTVDTAGKYEYHVASPNEFCPDDMAVIYVSVSDFASAGEDISVQVLEDGGPVDLSAELNATPGTNITWSPVLASGTSIFDPAEDAPGVYTATVTNDEGCNDDTAEVTVMLQPGDGTGNCPIVDTSVQSFCQSEGTGNNYYRPSVAHLSATANGEDIAWYDTAVSGEPLALDELLIDGGDYFAGTVSGTCSERQMVMVELMDSPSAGATTFLTVNSDDEPFDLVEMLEESILGPAEAGGTVNPPLASGTTLFDPSVDVGGQYTYTVSSTTDCPDDVAVCYITVNDSGELSVTASEDIAMYPNPSRGNINFTVNKGVIAKSIRIFDLNGNTVKSMKLNSESDLQNLDISSLRPSIYFAEILTDKGTVVKRILKN